MLLENLFGRKDDLQLEVGMLLLSAWARVMTIPSNSDARRGNSWRGEGRVGDGKGRSASRMKTCLHTANIKVVASSLISSTRVA
jgi:hypothetical protein